MQSSSNTFGTFLQTFETLGTKGRRPSRVPDAKSLYELIDRIAGSPQPPLLKDLIADMGWSREDFLGVLMQGRSEGLIEVDESAAEPTVRVTALGKAFSA